MGKTFTQTEVEEILRKRLKRGTVTVSEAETILRENNLPESLAVALNRNTKESFENAVEIILKLLHV